MVSYINVNKLVNNDLRRSEQTCCPAAPAASAILMTLASSTLFMTDEGTAAGGGTAAATSRSPMDQPARSRSPMDQPARSGRKDWTGGSKYPGTDPVKRDMGRATSLPEFDFPELGYSNTNLFSPRIQGHQGRNGGGRQRKRGLAGPDPTPF